MRLGMVGPTVEVLRLTTLTLNLQTLSSVLQGRSRVDCDGGQMVLVGGNRRSDVYEYTINENITCALFE